MKHKKIAKTSNIYEWQDGESHLILHLNMVCRRRCEVAEELVEKNFDLAFQIIYDFNLTGMKLLVSVLTTSEYEALSPAIDMNLEIVGKWMHPCDYVLGHLSETHVFLLVIADPTFALVQNFFNYYR